MRPALVFSFFSITSCNQATFPRLLIVKTPLLVIKHVTHDFLMIFLGIDYNHCSHENVGVNFLSQLFAKFKLF